MTLKKQQKLTLPPVSKKKSAGINLRTQETNDPSRERLLSL